jgi:cell division protein FtsI/penicillin-binding protein 2
MSLRHRRGAHAATRPRSLPGASAGAIARKYAERARRPRGRDRRAGAIGQATAENDAAPGHELTPAGYVPERGTLAEVTSAAGSAGQRSGAPPAVPRDQPLRPAGPRRHLTRKRIVAATVVAGLIVLGLAVGWGTPRPSAEPTVAAFLLDWQDGQYQAAAAVTTGRQPEVAAALADADRQLGAVDRSLSMGPISQHGDRATASFDASVDLGRGGLPWTYQGRLQLREIDGTWKVVWSPAVIVPGLRPGLRLAVITTMPQRAGLLDSAGRPLLRKAEVVVVGVSPGHLPHPRVTADAFAAATGLEASQVRDEIMAAPATRFFELDRLSPAAYRHLSRRLSRVPGLIIRQERMRLFDSIAAPVTGSVGTETARVLRIDGVPYRPGSTVGESGLQLAYQRRLVGTPTTEVVAENATGRIVTVLRRWPGQPGEPVRTTIDARVQLAADQALSSLPNSAAIVAVAPGTGHILAVAEHTGHGMPAVQALSGHYRPGQAFTIVSTAALLSTGFSPAAPIPCRTVNLVGGKTFTNDPPEPAAGRQWLFSGDFAHACATAFAGVSLNLDGADLMRAAEHGFSLGGSWQLPLASFAGSMRFPAGPAALAEDAIGDGSVRVSPLQMAVIAGVAASGAWHQPVLVTSPADSVQQPRASFRNQVVSQLRALMRGTVTSGAGRAANVAGGPVYGQVGTARLGRGTRLYATWFVGFQGGVAFAVVEFTRSPADSAVPLAGTFLRSLHGSP